MTANGYRVSLGDEMFLNFVQFLNILKPLNCVFLNGESLVYEFSLLKLQYAHFVLTLYVGN